MTDTDGVCAAAPPTAALAGRRHAAVATALAGVGLTLAAAASAGGTPPPSRTLPSQAALLEGAPLAGGGAPAAADADAALVLGLSREMRDFVARHVDRRAADPVKLRQLVDAIMGDDTFGLVYDETTRTAAGAFQTRRGNCLSFCAMLVAMAREAGLDAVFQEVDIPPDWTLAADTFVLNRHVNVRVELGTAGVRAVDFNIADFRSTYALRPITDARALSHYRNNLGVERMQAGDVAGALAWLAAAAAGDRRFSPAWTNLGTLYLRHGHPAHAEAAYLQALAASPSDHVAMSNLARLYEAHGEPARAAALRARVHAHRMRNPYFREDLARRAIEARRWDEAIGHLKAAVRLRPREDRFFSLLGLSYLRKGDERAARAWYARAAAAATSDSARSLYSAKMEMLSHAAGSGRH